MIDWHHPRICERLRCVGFCLFTSGIAWHLSSNPPAALATTVVTLLLLVRLKIELDIRRDEEEETLARKLQRISRINSMLAVPAFIGMFAIIRQTANGEG